MMPLIRWHGGISVIMRTHISENATAVLQDAERRFIPPTCYMETAMLTQKCFLMNAWIGLINGPISIPAEA